MERNRRGVGNIQACERASGRNAAKPIASLSRQLAETFSLRAEHEGERKGQGSGSPAPRLPPRPSQRARTRVRRARQGLRQVSNQDHRHDVESAARGLGQGPGQWRAVPRRQHECRGPKDGRRAQDGADILRIGDLIEHEQDAFRSTLRGSMGGKEAVSSTTP